MPDDLKPAAERGRLALERLLRVPALLSGLVLAAIMMITVVDVSLRFMNAPLYGTQEITELAMVALIMLAIPYCAITKGHIQVDILDTALGSAGRRIADFFAAIVSLIILGFLIWNTAFKAVDTLQYADVTNLLALPLWPIYALIALSMAGYALVVAQDLVAFIARRRGKNE